MTNASTGMSASLTRRAFDLSQRTAQLGALAIELRRGLTWIALCRLAGREHPEWLRERLLEDDPLLAAMAIAGDPQRTWSAGRATAALAYMLCGEVGEAEALAMGCAVTGEPAPGTLASLDPTAQPKLADLVADLRAPRSRAHGAATRTVADVDGICDAATASAVVVAGRAPGFRLDAAARLFKPAAPELDEVAAKVAAAIGPADEAVLLDLWRPDDRVARGDACQAALLAAAFAALGKHDGDASTTIVGRLDGSRVLPPRRPDAADVTKWLNVQEHAPGAVVAPQPAVQGTEVITSVAALSTYVGRRKRRQRRQRAIAVASSLSLVVGVLALVILGTGSPRDPDRVARRALALLPADPNRAAALAAEALADRRTPLTTFTSLTITGRNALTLATAKERGRVVAVAIARDLVTTVSTAGRATRWRVRGERLTALGAVAVPRRLSVTALSRGGHWLLATPKSGRTGQRLLIDLTGRTPTRLLAVTERDKALIQISDGAVPTIATAHADTGLSVQGAPAFPRISARVTAMRFSPSGRRLAIGTSRGATRVFRQTRDGWAAETRWRAMLPGTPITLVDVDDDDHVLAAGSSTPLSGLRARWSTRNVLRPPTRRTADSLLLTGDATALSIAQSDVEVLNYGAPGDAGSALTLDRVDDPASVSPVAADPRARLAVIAETAGRLVILDLRQVHPIAHDALSGSISVDARAVRVLLRGSSRQFAWSVGTGARVSLPPARREAAPHVAETDRNGTYAVYGTDDGTVHVRNLHTDTVVARLRGAAHADWGAVSVSGDGATVAAIDTRASTVTVWKDALGAAPRVVDTASVGRPRQDGPLVPLAVSADGRTVFVGGTQPRVRDLGTGREWRVATGALGTLVRARFFGSVLYLSGERRVGTAAAPRWPVTARERSSLDTVPLGVGLLGITDPDGIHGLPPSGSPVDLPYGFGNDHRVPDTIAVDPRRTRFVAAGGGNGALVVLRTPTTDPRRLCALADGRVATPGGCGPVRPLPAVRGPRTAASLPLSRSTLGPEGLGPVAFGRRLPAALERATGYRYGDCVLRALPGIAASVVTYRGQVEAISAYDPPFVLDDRPFREDRVVVTSLGLSPASAKHDARAIYGPPAGKELGRPVWRLLDAAGRVRMLSVGTSVGTRAPVRITVPERHCETAHRSGRPTLTVRAGARTTSEPARTTRVHGHGKVVGLAFTAGGVRVAQSDTITDVAPDGAERVRQRFDAATPVVAMAQDGLHYAVQEPDGVRVGGGPGFRAGTTTVGGGTDAPVSVLNGTRPRVFLGRVVDLTTGQYDQEMYSGTATAAGADRVAIGTSEGTTTTLSATDGGVKRTYRRAVRARYGAEITAVDADRRHVVTLDRAGWVSCDGTSAAHVLPPAPPGMPAVVRRAGTGAWVLRGGRAVLVACRARRVDTTCVVRSRHADPGQAALAVSAGRVLAAGVVAGSIVDLPGCR